MVRNDGTACCCGKNTKKSPNDKIATFGGCNSFQFSVKKNLKNSMQDLDIADYDYDLPEDRIAQYPVQERDRSKLLVYKENKITSDVFGNLGLYLPARSLLVFNNTRVIRARLLFRKDSGAAIEILCLEPVDPPVYEQSFSSSGPVEWKCIIGNLRKWKAGTLYLEFRSANKTWKFSAEKLYSEGEAWRIRFSWDKPSATFSEMIESVGHIPLPPYISREDEKDDALRYQTIYSEVSGSVAAPTAGLHFTDALLDNLDRKGFRRTDITLHVGAGTFQPVRSKTISGHEMHSEHFFFSAETITALLENKGRITAVGTTSVRSLETMYWLGVKVLNNPGMTAGDLSIGQWEPYGNSNSVTFDESLTALSDFMRRNGLSAAEALTQIIIIPGYEFKTIDALITNFHQPRSTLLLLVSAWAGNKWREIYDYALRNDFRFLSYGDSSLLFAKCRHD